MGKKTSAVSVLGAGVEEEEEEDGQSGVTGVGRKKKDGGGGEREEDGSHASRSRDLSVRNVIGFLFNWHAIHYYIFFGTDGVRYSTLTENSNRRWLAVTVTPGVQLQAPALHLF